MARVVILGAGIAGHTAAMALGRALPKEHTVCVVSPKPDDNWIPSNIWVGVGRMARDEVVVPLAPIYAVPAPTPFTLWTRPFLPWQLLRFVWINVKMLRMIVLSGPKPIQPASAGAPRT